MLNFLSWCIVGALAGWIASKIMKTSGGLLKNILLGIGGSFVGGLVAGFFGISARTFSVGGVLVAAIGACVIIWLARKFAK
ncbi:MAG: GlsB/YeaQ/YmgE family stress response membrane protein [Clostridiales bacterium]|nr:GlsB/YeaQ/YmgE family stress response membrane protein [Clostridiales bacterium]